MDVINEVAGHVFKLSYLDPKIENLSRPDLFYDYDLVARHNNFNAEPTNFHQAALRWIFLHPTPPSVYDWLPNFSEEAELPEQVQFLPLRSYLLLSGNETIEPKLAGDTDTKTEHIELDYHVESVSDVHAGVRIHPKWRFFHNMHTDDKSCATRLLHILGIRNVPRERFADIDKVGVWTPQNERLFSLAWHTGMIVSFTNSAQDVDGYPGKCLNLMISDLRSTLLGVPLQTSLPVYFAIFCFRNHVAFAISENHIDKVLSHLRIGAPTLSPDKIVSLYSPPTGRAGGKVFVQPAVLKTIPRITLLQNALLYRLRENNHLLNWEQIMITAMLLLQYLHLGAGDVLLWIVLNDTIWRSDFLSIVKILKAAHAETRVKHKLPNLSVHYARSTLARPWAQALYGLDTLPGRSEKFKLDFQAEQLMRTIDTSKRAWPTIVQDRYGNNYIKFFPEKYTQRVRVIARKTAEDLLKSEVHLETFSEFFSNRMFWGASGGAPGASVVWDDTNEKLRVNKRGALLSLTERKVRKILNYMKENPSPRPIQWSVKAIKYESGKLRSILNTVLENYVIQGYIFNSVDANSRTDSWYSSTHDNPARIANALRRLLDLKSRPGLMWDYADFNLNHTFYLMAQEYLARVDVLLERASTDIPLDTLNVIKDDMRCATAYAVLARYSTYLHDPENKVTVKASRSLQSGERGTSSINSDSNETDTTIVREVCIEMLGIDPIAKVTDHAGDDAFENVISMTYAPLVCSVYNLTGAAGQAKKIAVAYATFGGASGEFLRLAYDAAANTISGYPIRGMMGFIHGEFFSEAIPEPFDRLASFINQRNKLQRRGWTAPKSLFEAVCRYNTRLSYTESNGKVSHFYPDIETAITPAAFGGVGVDSTDKQLISQLSDSEMIKPITQAPPYDAILIPSGEGKSTLSMKYSNLFIDHDTLTSTTILQGLRATANLTGDWIPLNNYLKQVAADCPQLTVNGGTKVLLTWSPDTTPKGCKICAMLLEKPVGLRANVANRKSIERCMSDKYILRFKDYASRDSHLMNVVLTIHSVAYQVKRRLGDPPPKFEWPRIDSRELLRRSKTVMKDHATLHKYGLPMDVSITDAVAQSALSGAWPKDALYSSIAAHARALSKWAKASKFDTIIIPPLPLTSELNFCRLVKSLVIETLGLTGTTSGDQDKATGRLRFKENDLGRPKTKSLRHHYNYVPTLTKLCGCSVNAATQFLISKSRGDNFLERVSSLLTNEIHSSKSRQKPTGQIQELLSYIKRLQTLPVRSIYKDESYVGYSLAELWFTGGLQFIPPAVSLQSADLTTFVRDITLRVIEDNFLLNLSTLTDLQQIVVTIHHYEKLTQNTVTRVLHAVIPGVIMRD